MMKIQKPKVEGNYRTNVAEDTRIQEICAQFPDPEVLTRIVKHPVDSRWPNTVHISKTCESLGLPSEHNFEGNWENKAYWFAVIVLAARNGVTLTQAQMTWRKSKRWI